MVHHRQGDRATHRATLYDEEWVEDDTDDENLDGGYYDPDQPIREDVPVQYVAGGDDLIREETGERTRSNPELDWPPSDIDIVRTGQEVTLSIDDHEQRYEIVNVTPVFGRWKAPDKLAVEIEPV